MRDLFTKRRLIAAFKIALSAGLCAWLVSQMLAREGVDELGARLARIDGRWIAVAIALHFAAVLAGTVRWRLLLRAARIDKLGLGWLLRSFLVGRFVGAFTPSTTGLDGWRLWEAGRASGSMARAAGAIVVEKLVGLIGMAIVCAMLLPFGPTLGASAYGIAFVLAAISVFALVCVRRPAWLSATAARMPKIVRPRAAKIADALSSSRLDGRQSAKAIGLGLASHAALSCVFFATARAIGVQTDAVTLLAVGNTIVIAVLLPISIGGIGVREGVAVVLLAGAGVGATEAMLVALLGYLTGQVPALAGGVLFALRSADQRSIAASTSPQTPHAHTS
jgi:uncharacterized membrane protein YbhN (UPF0104 family)